MSLTIYGNGAKSFGQPFMEMVKTLFSDDNAIGCHLHQKAVELRLL
jgi:hypothetical protein